MWNLKLSWICKTIINRFHCKFASMRVEHVQGARAERAVAASNASKTRERARVERVAAASTASNHVVNLLAPRGRRDGASIGQDGDIMTVCDSGQTRTRTSENKGPRFGLPMRGIRLIQKNYLR